MADQAVNHDRVRGPNFMRTILMVIFLYFVGELLEEDHPTDDTFPITNYIFRSFSYFFHKVVIGATTPDLTVEGINESLHPISGKCFTWRIKGHLEAYQWCHGGRSTIFWEMDTESREPEFQLDLGVHINSTIQLEQDWRPEMIHHFQGGDACPNPANLPGHDPSALLAADVYLWCCQEDGRGDLPC
ncbi:unnamed protein product, partial [Choristocarpus tenellus]